MDGLNGWNHHLLEADTFPSMLYNVPTQGNVLGSL